VITKVIQRERTHTGRFGIGRFCPRRFKRLTPALAVMVGVTTILALFLLSPFGLQQRAAETGLGEVLVAATS
jgi:peptidoglycan/LPS O-acetylase OafA/YrhL